MSKTDSDVCRHLLKTDDDEERNLLSVQFTGSVTADGLTPMNARPAGRPDRMGIISVGDQLRSATQDATPDAKPTGPLSMETIADPRDLTRLGNTVSNYLSAWENNENRTVVCFDSLSSLLHHTDRERVFRFLHVFTGRLQARQASAHFHLDPTAHDRQTVESLVHLFDTVIDVADDDVVVRSRPSVAGD